MILSHFLPDLPPLVNTVQISGIDKRIFADCKHVKANRPAEQQPQETALFGHLINPDYVAPPDDGWLDVPQAAQPEGAGQDVVGEASQQPPPQVEQVPQAAAHQEVLEEVLHQLEQPPPQGADPIDPVVAETVVHEVLQQGVEQGAENVDDIFHEIDNYVGGDENIEPMDIDAAPKEGDNDGDKDDEATDSDSDNDDDEGDFVIQQYGSRMISMKRSGPPPESSSRGKRKLNDDDDYEPDVDETSLIPRRVKRVARTGGIVISETTEQTATTTEPTTATATTTPLPTSTVPTTSMPTFTVLDTLRISELAEKFLVLNRLH